jgi:hypothetical protein
MHNFTRSVLLLLLFASSMSAQQSWVWARDDNSRMINMNTDSISILLLESRVPSGNNFISNDKEVGLLVDTQFTGSTADQPKASRDFPFMFAQTADALSDPDHKSSKVLTNQEILVDFFPLSDGKTVYRGVSIGVTLLRKSNPAVWTGVLDTLLTATKKVSSLPSPLSLGVTYLSDFSTDVLHKYLPDPDAQKRIDLGTLSFIVSSNNAELNRVVNTGLHLRIMPSTKAGGGWVDPSKWDEYCFYTKFDSSNWIVYVSPKDANAADKDAAGCPKSKYTPLMNDYIPILIEAEQTPAPPSHLLNHITELGMGSDGDALKKLHDRAADLKSAAVKQCQAYKVEDVKCPAIRGD